MSNIRLKVITVEPSQSPLIIKNGNVSITDTTISNNMITGALIVNGGLAINCTSDSVSSTSGGGLTLGGGFAVTRKSNFGDNITLDNSSSVLKVNGISNNRLFLDSIANKNFYISPDGVTKSLDLYDTTLKINITSGSVNSSSAAFVVSGGISINSSLDSTSISSGGALTVNGGASFNGNLNINKGLTINSSGNNGLIIGYTGDQITLNGTTANSTISMTNDNLIINNSGDISLLGNNININTLTVSNSFSSFSKFVEITDTVDSKNSTTGSLIVEGGISIKSTSDSSSFTSGGALTISGGLAINKKVYTGDSIGIEMSNINKNNKIVMYQQDQDITNTFLFTGLGVNTSGSMRFQVPSESSDYIFHSATTSGSTEILRIKGTNEVQFIGSNQKYSILGGGFNSDSISFQSNSLATDFSLDLFTQDGDGNDNNDIKIFGLGLPNSVTNSEYLQLGWDKNDMKYIISSNNTGTGISRDISFNSDQLLLSTDDSIYFKTTKVSTNSSTGGLVINGGISIDCNIDASSLTEGGSLTVNGGSSFSGNMYLGTSLNINVSSGSDIIVSSQDDFGTFLVQSPSASMIICGISNGNTYASNLSLYSLNNFQFLDYELLDIKCSSEDITGYYSIYSLYGGTGINRAIQLGVDTFTHITLNTNGNVGINTTDANFTLDILGNINATDYSYITGLTINDTQPALNSTTASLVVEGGVGIKKELITLGLTQFQNGTSSSNSTTGSVVMSGGLSINNAVNSTNISSGGGLTVRGGAAIGGDLHIGGTIYYANAASVSNTYAYLTLTATDESISVANGSLITFGGISIQSQLNATSTTSGGGLTVIGGIATQNDLYVGGNINVVGGVMNFYSISSGNLLQLYDTNGVKRTSLDLNSSNNNFQISRYNNSLLDKPFEIINSSGIIKLNNTFNSTAVGTGALVSEGGITINCSTNSSSLGNGGAFSVFGGTSISKNLYVGGNTVFSNTTVSNDVSSGSVLVAGGVGISGNLNVLGNTILSGNLTIIGSTTSVQSTNTLLTDNILVLNSGPSGTKDSGFLIQRYQFDNDTSTGDVVNDTAFFTDTLPLQTGMTSTQLKLSISASSSDDYYNNWYVKITSGFSNDQVRKIIDYVGSTRIATLSSPFTDQNPSLSDSVSLYNKPYLGLFYSEINDRFEFGSTVQDPGQGSIALTDYLPIIFRSATSTSTQESTSSTTGAILLTGGLGINNTTDAVSITSGGAATIAGGLSVRKTLYVGNTAYINGVNITPNLYDTPSTVSFTGANVLTPTDVTGLVFNSSVWGADIYISTRILATTSYYSNIHIRCVNKNGTWESVSEYVGDNVVAFDITSSGQIQYITSTTFPGFSSCIFRYKVVTN